MMRRNFLVTVISALCASVASASDFSASVEACESNNITVPPGCNIDYSVLGQLSDMINVGLALVSGDLELQDSVGANAGALNAGSAPTELPMIRFDRPDGITNPPAPCPGQCGYGGTLINGKIIQFGGGQNTINNPGGVGFAPFPSGPVAPNVAQPTVCANDAGCPNTSVCRGGTCWQILLTGSVAAPAVPGNYNLVISSVIANAILAGENGIPFWKVGTANAPVQNLTNLAITVASAAQCCGVACALVSSFPPSGSIDARQPSDPNGTNPQGWQSVKLTFDCTSLASLGSGNFTMFESGGDATAPQINTITPVLGDANSVNVTFLTPFEARTWTKITHNDSGQSVCLGFLPGSVDGDSTSNPAIDLTALIDCLNSPGSCEEWQEDIDRDGTTAVTDLTRLIDLYNGAVLFQNWTNASLGASPCVP